MRGTASVRRGVVVPCVFKLYVCASYITKLKELVFKVTNDELELAKLVSELCKERTLAGQRLGIYTQ